MKRLHILSICLLLFIAAKAQITNHPSNNVSIGSSSDNGHKFEVLKNTTGQTSSSRVASFHNTGSTFSASTGDRMSYAGHFLSTSSRIAGPYGLTNVGLYAAASGGTFNYAALFPAGQVGIGTEEPHQLGGNLVVHGGLAATGSTPAIPVMTINASTSNTDALHIRYGAGAYPGYEGTLTLRIGANGAAAFGGISAGAYGYLSNVATSYFTAATPGYIATLVDGVAGQTANLLQVRDNISNQATHFTVNAQGRVGIGTSTPWNSKLQVNGVVRVDCSYDPNGGLVLTNEDDS